MGIGIPDKLFFKIGEVAELVSLRPSVLRYWESEFACLKPGKSRSGQRLYSKKDVELVFDIKRLLYSEKLTIEGAKKQITGRSRAASKSEEGAETRCYDILSEIRDDLTNLRNSLS